MKEAPMKYLNVVAVVGFFLQCSADSQVSDVPSDDVLAQDANQKMNRISSVPKSERRRLSGGGGAFDCEFCGPPFGPASGDATAYFPPNPHSAGQRLISIGSMANDYNCNSLEGDQATACIALQQQYGYANLAWYQSQDPDKDHTLASVISSIGYPSAVQFSVGATADQVQVSND